MATPHVSGAIAVLLSANLGPRPLTRPLGAPNNSVGNGVLSLDPSSVPIPTGHATLQALDFVPAAVFGVAAALVFGFMLSR